MDQLALRELDAAIRTRFDIFLMMAFHTINPGSRYLDNWHVDAMVNQAEAIVRGDVKRLIVNVPPRNLKLSRLTSRLAPSSWVMRRISAFLQLVTASGSPRTMQRSFAPSSNPIGFAAVFLTCESSGWSTMTFFNHRARLSQVDVDIRGTYRHGRRRFHRR